MKTLNRIPNVLVGCLLCFSLLWPKDCDAQIKEMSTEELTKKSTAVFVGKCAKVRSEWNAEHTIILTHVTIFPEEYVKGNLGTEAILTIPGGRVDNIVYEVSEMPAFIEGEEVVAFAWRHPSGKNLVTGGYQGKLKIEKDKQTGKRMVHNVTSIGMEEADMIEDDYKKAKKFRKVLLEDYISELRGYINQ